MGDDMMRQEIGPFEHDVERKVPLLFPELDGVLTYNDAGIIEEDIDATELADRLLYGPAAIGLRADVARDEERPAASGGDSFGGRGSFLPVDVKKDDPSPEFCQPAG
jgi:hypothetical protein